MNTSDNFDNITVASGGTATPDSSYTITVPVTASTWATTTGGYISVTNGGTSGTTLVSNGAGSGFNWSMIDTIPFETGFPDWNDFQKMCKEYPGLEKTFEHMKAFYKLCKDDWETKQKGE